MAAKHLVARLITGEWAIMTIIRTLPTRLELVPGSQRKLGGRSSWPTWVARRRRISSSSGVEHSITAQEMLDRLSASERAKRQQRDKFMSGDKDRYRRVEILKQSSDFFVPRGNFVALKQEGKFRNSNKVIMMIKVAKKRLNHASSHQAAHHHRRRLVLSSHGDEQLVALCD